MRDSVRALVKSEIVIRDKKGRVLQAIRPRSPKYVINFVDILQIFLNNTARTLTRTNDLNTSYTPSWAYKCNAPANDDSNGLVVGSGANPVAVTDTKLQTQIAHGVGAGQLSYSATTISAPSTAGSTRKFTVQRMFTNNSGAQVTINEAGLYIADIGSSQLYKFCFIREAVSPGINVADGASATVTYTIGVTV